MKSRVTVISDTHWRHEGLQLPPGDLLIHCGDMLNLGGRSNSLKKIDEWFGRQQFQLILCTGGNHDQELQSALNQRSQPLDNARFLQDELVEFRGLKIYGAPWVPDLPGQAFFKTKPALTEVWSRIPTGPDILITHTPPKGMLDRSSKGRCHGCEALSQELKRVRPRVHCFGHVHASAGCSRVGDTLFINASSVNSGAGTMRQPVTFSLSPQGRPELIEFRKRRPLSAWLRRLTS